MDIQWASEEVLRRLPTSEEAPHILRRKLVSTIIEAEDSQEATAPLVSLLALAFLGQQVAVSWASSASSSITLASLVFGTSRLLCKCCTTWDWQKPHSVQQISTDMNTNYHTTCLRAASRDSLQITIIINTTTIIVIIFFPKRKLANRELQFFISGLKIKLKTTKLLPIQNILFLLLPQHRLLFLFSTLLSFSPSN